MNSVSSTTSAAVNAYSAYTSTSKTTKTQSTGTSSSSSSISSLTSSILTAGSSSTSAADAINGTAAVYEASSDTTETSSTGKTSQSNSAIIAQLKEDQEAHTQQLQDIVNKLMTKQGIAYNQANGLKDFFANLEVDEETQAQAQKDIAEDGYWGVNQTSDRIFDFAMALTGGDTDKMNDMLEAFEKGFKQATDSWGDELPDICQQTYAAIEQKFADYAAQNETATEE